MQVIGLCRFSYPAIGGFRIEHETIEQRRRYLYDTARLEERFRLFEASTLPCLREQTDQDFTFLIVVGTCLPKLALDRLHDLTRGMKQVRIIAREPIRHRVAMQAVLNAARDDLSQPCLQFRHDDDDAVSVDFVERLRKATRDAPGLLARHRMVTIDFNCGFLARFNAQGIQATQVFKPLLGVAFATYVRGGHEKSIMNFAHHKIGNFMPVLSYPDAPMWVRTLNNFNDSPNAHKGKDRLQPLTPQQEAEFIARFAIDQDVVRRVHSAS